MCPDSLSGERAQGHQRSSEESHKWSSREKELLVTLAPRLGLSVILLSMIFMSSSGYWLSVVILDPDPGRTALAVIQCHQTMAYLGCHDCLRVMTRHLQVLRASALRALVLNQENTCLSFEDGLHYKSKEQDVRALAFPAFHKIVLPWKRLYKQSKVWGPWAPSLMQLSLLFCPVQLLARWHPKNNSKGQWEYQGTMDYNGGSLNCLDHTCHLLNIDSDQPSGWVPWIIRSGQ